MVIEVRYLEKYCVEVKETKLWLSLIVNDNRALPYKKEVIDNDWKRVKTEIMWTSKHRLKETKT